ncbi:MAG: peptidoglycan DD-metalloendopeptidase family protein [Acidisphaera sp.]|nr:peptidoglycan DD-metalloendopeptidase family protein [Acidisphaera sp.]
MKLLAKYGVEQVRLARTCSSAALSLLLLAAAAPGPQAARQALEQAERDRAAQLAAQQQAALRLREAQAAAARLAAERVAAASRLRQAESATADAAARMSALAGQRRDAEARLAVRAADLAPLLPVIERLSLFPAETLLAVPAPPEAALRGVLVLQGITGELEHEAEALRREQADVAALAAAMQEEAPRLAAAQAAQAIQAAALDAQIQAAGQMVHAAEDMGAEAERRAAAEAARADTLRGALAALETERRAAEARARDDALRAGRQKHDAEADAARQRQLALARPAGPGLAEPRGQLTAPVAGTVVRSWGEATDAGPANGLSYQAPPSARVVSPCGGKVVFAAPFRSYGLLLIVDCGGGYHFVLAGLDRLDAQVGSSVQAGEPVGVMPGWDPRTPGDRPALYVELRHDGQPVNPAPWLRARG